MLWKNHNKLEKILKIIQKFPQWLVYRELTKNEMIAYVSKKKLRPRKIRKNSKNYPKIPTMVI